VQALIKFKLYLFSYIYFSNLSLFPGCRETAFVYAMTSASMAHHISRACSDGSIYTCSCGHLTAPVQQQQSTAHRPSGLGQTIREKSASPLNNVVVSPEWQWGGCSDNAEFGQKFSRDFIDATENARDLRCAVNIHNNEAGRLVITVYCHSLRFLYFCNSFIVLFILRTAKGTKLWAYCIVYSI